MNEGKLKQGHFFASSALNFVFGSSMNFTPRVWRVYLLARLKVFPVWSDVSFQLAHKYPELMRECALREFNGVVVWAIFCVWLEK